MTSFALPFLRSTGKQRPAKGRAHGRGEALLLIVFLGTVASSALLARVSAWPDSVDPAGGPLAMAPAQSSSSSVPRRAAPEHIRIPRLKIDRPVESLGLTKNGAMQVPKHTMNVGWFRLGYRPGEKGSAVIAGHLNGVDGSLGIFWDLKSMEQGDAVEVVAADGSVQRFVVDRVEEYLEEEVPMQEMFGASDEPVLRLMTCSGEWSWTEFHYDKRLIVTARLEDGFAKNTSLLE